MTHLQKNGTGFLVRVFGTGFWWVCRLHKIGDELPRNGPAPSAHSSSSGKTQFRTCNLLGLSVECEVKLYSHSRLKNLLMNDTESRPDE